MKSREQVLQDPVFSALKEVGHKPEDDIYVWSQGMAFHHQNLLDGLQENVTNPTKRKQVLYDLWSYFYTVGMEKVNIVLGIEKEPNVEKINKTLSDILRDKNHPAILGMGARSSLAQLPRCSRVSSPARAEPLWQSRMRCLFSRLRSMKPFFPVTGRRRPCCRTN